jgi:hypothetical protein
MKQLEQRKEIKTKYTTEVIFISDSSEAVDSFYDNYLKRYAFEGYQTTLQSKEVLEDGRYQIVIKRYNICE